MPSTRACACGLRTNATSRMPGSATSATKQARPRRWRASSLRSSRAPMPDRDAGAGLAMAASCRQSAGPDKHLAAARAGSSRVCRPLAYWRHANRPSEEEPMPKGKLRHVAMSVQDPHKTAEFYKQAFGMELVGETDSDLAQGVFLSDGVINLALLKFKTDEMAQ